MNHWHALSAKASNAAPVSGSIEKRSPQVRKIPHRIQPHNVNVLSIDGGNVSIFAEYVN